MHLIVVDMGVPGQPLKTKYGLYSQWFIRAFSAIDETTMVDGFSVDDVDIEDLLECDGVILSGAEENVADDLSWRSDFEPVLNPCLTTNNLFLVSVLGISFSATISVESLNDKAERNSSVILS
jgi:GMP synthase-like glutamine amidotransferase